MLASEDAGAGALLRRAGPAELLGGGPHVAVEDERLRAALDPYAPLLCLYDKAAFSEGTVWDAPRGRLVWSDVVGRRVLAWHPDGSVRVVLDGTAFINGNGLDRDGNLVHCEHGRRCVSRSAGDGEPVPFLTHVDGRRFNSPNDIARAPDGSLWFTDPTFGLELPQQGALRQEEVGCRGLYRHDPASGETALMAEFDQPNGIAFSPDGRTVYVTDTSRALGGDGHEIVAFALAPDGRLAKRRRFALVEPGIPDGIAIDRRGWLWSATGSGVQVFDAGGTRLGRIETPAACANLAFGGPDGSRLFMAAERRLLAVDLAIQACP